MRGILKAVFVVIFSTNVLAQSGVGIFDFSNIPQTNLLNPAYQTANKLHVSVPFLGNHQAFLGVSGVIYQDLFDEAIPVETRLKTASYKLSDRDLGLFRHTSEIINLGYRTQEVFYSGGFYVESLAFARYPKSVSDLYYEGYTIPGKEYSVDNINMQSGLLGVYHFGLQKKWDENISVGIRFKLYNQVFDARSSQNQGTITTQYNLNGTYQYVATGIEAAFHSSGFFVEEGTDVDRAYVIKKLLFTGNKGLGFDLGISKDLDKNWYLSTSLLDIGFVWHKKGTKNYSAKGAIATQEINEPFNASNPEDYWPLIDDYLLEDVDYTMDRKSYFTMRPVQWNGMVKYKMYKRQRTNLCSYEKQAQNKFDYSSAVGGFSKIQIYNGMVLPSLSAFYEQNVAGFFQFRTSYTVDRFSLTNVGLVTSFQFSKVNLYLAADNIIGFINYQKSHSAYAQLGMNVVF